MFDVCHGPKPAEEWTDEERFDALAELGAYDYIPVSPATVTHRERASDLEKREIWQLTEMQSYRAIVRVWPDP